MLSCCFLSAIFVQGTFGKTSTIAITLSVVTTEIMASFLAV